MHTLRTDASCINGKYFACAFIDGHAHVQPLDVRNIADAEIEAILMGLQFCEYLDVRIETDQLMVVRHFIEAKFPKHPSRSFHALVTMASKYRIVWRWVKSSHKDGVHKTVHAYARRNA